jgi:putative drug exporter of the RND superfamily
MLVITRAMIAEAVIVGTVLHPLWTSFGLSVLIWQYTLGMQLQTGVPGDIRCIQRRERHLR